MYPLLLCSVLIWAVVLEKGWFLFQMRRQFSNLHLKATDLIQEQKIMEAKGLGYNSHPLIASSYLSIFERNEGESRGLWEERVSRRFSETHMGLKRFLWILATIGSLAPFIGLFGTVIGIIKSFDSIAITGKSGFGVVAQGLSEALIATAAGIIVAVVALIFYNYFQTRLNRVSLEMKNKLEDLMDLV